MKILICIYVSWILNENISIRMNIWFHNLLIIMLSKRLRYRPDYKFGGGVGMGLCVWDGVSVWGCNWKAGWVIVRVSMQIIFCYYFHDIKIFYAKYKLCDVAVMYFNINELRPTLSKIVIMNYFIACKLLTLLMA